MKYKLKNIVKRILKEHGPMPHHLLNNAACANDPNARLVTFEGNCQGPGYQYVLPDRCVTIDGGAIIPAVGMMMNLEPLAAVMYNGQIVYPTFEITSVAPMTGPAVASFDFHASQVLALTPGTCGYNCSGAPNYSCTYDQSGNAQFSTQNDCIDNCNANNPGCPSGTNPSFNFNTSCSPNDSYHTWAGGYTTIGNSFMWHGGTITDPISGNTINNGDLVDASLINMINANQSSYCEWCDDFAQGGGSSTQFNAWLPLWHSPTQVQPWSPTTIPSNPEAYCCCCPGQGGGPFNSTLGLLAAPPSDEPGIDPSDLGDKEPDCCAWCATVDPNIPSKPPKGCYDFNCDNCPNIPKTPTLTENFINSLKIKAGIIK